MCGSNTNAHKTHTFYISDEELGRTRTDHLIADVHVVVGSVDFRFVRPGRAVAFGGLRRQRGVVGVLPVLSLLLAVVTLLFFVVVSGDLLEDTRVLTRSEKSTRARQAA